MNDENICLKIVSVFKYLYVAVVEPEKNSHLLLKCDIKFSCCQVNWFTLEYVLNHDRNDHNTKSMDR